MEFSFKLQVKDMSLGVQISGSMQTSASCTYDTVPNKHQNPDLNMSFDMALL